MTALPPKNAATVAPSGLPGWMVGLGILILMVALANGILVWLSSKGHRDLVRSDYYDHGLQEDKTIARNALGRAAGQVELRRTAAGWQVETETDMPGAQVLKAHFYRPDDGREDRVVVLARPPVGAPEGHGFWEGSGPGLRRGRWVVNLVWEENGAPLSETTVIHQEQ